MATYSIGTHVKEIICLFFKKDPKRVSDSDTIRKLGAGQSYSSKDLIHCLEYTFNVRFSIRAKIESMSVQDVIDFILRKKAGQRK